MAWAEHFHETVLQTFRSRTNPPELLPTVLSQAVVAVLPVDGAGISMTDELRVPLGSSDALAARAERLQTTLGQGPCLSAARDAEPVVADLATMQRRWPLFHRDLSVQTPYRSVASLPLQVEDRVLGALDLYATTGETLAPELVHEVGRELADLVAAMVFAAPAGSTGTFAPPLWLGADSVIDRMNVWVAVGMLQEETPLDNAAALATLRAYAAQHQATLDDVAADLTSGDLLVETVLR
jgi:hypothetical protein